MYNNKNIYIKLQQIAKLLGNHYFLIAILYIM